MRVGFCSGTINMINRYYYSVCNELEKKIYNTIFDGLSEYRTKISFYRCSEISGNVIGRVFKEVLYDNPRIFYTCTQGYYIEMSLTTITLIPKYFFSINAVLELQDWLDEMLIDICTPILETEDIFAKEIYIHNYLIQNVEYSDIAVSQPINAYTVVGTLFEKNSVCSGVALSFKLLMDFLEIPCITATGTAINSMGNIERHAWNIVYIEDEYYQVDVTWDLINGKNDRVIKYDYFNLTTDEMNKSRVTDYEYPLCISEKYNYFFYTDAIVYSTEQLIDYISNKIKIGEKSIYLKYHFKCIDINHIFPKLMKRVPLLGRYTYWIDELLHTIFILR